MGMLKLMATIFKKDVPQAEFFKKALKFEMDETSFVDTVNEQFEYEILCRFNQIKKKKMEEEDGGKIAPSQQNCNSTAACCLSKCIQDIISFLEETPWRIYI